MKILISITFIITLFLSCQDYDVFVENIETVKLDNPYADLLKSNNNTKTIINSAVYTNNGQGIERYYSLHNLNGLDNPSVLLRKNRIEDYSNLYAREISKLPSLSLSKTQEGEQSTKGVYIPQEISVSINGDSNPTVVKANDVITWNADDLNQNGVYITATYSASSAQGLSNLEAHPVSKEWAMVIEDTGSYTVKDSDLQGIPQNAFISFKIGRSGILQNADGSNSVVNTFSQSIMTVE